MQVSHLDSVLLLKFIFLYFLFSNVPLAIPAGILGAPVYGFGSKAVDYGSIGSVLGHEITHGFDNSGKKFNYKGNAENWWEPEALEAYKKRAGCFIDTYENYELTFTGISVKANGMLTFGENIADNGGFKEALLAYRKYVSQNGEEPILPKFENFTSDQLFTLGFGYIWCEHPTIISPYLTPFMDHSPNGIRVNGVLMNSDEFANIWQCPKGSKMNPNTEKCKVW